MAKNLKKKVVHIETCNISTLSWGLWNVVPWWSKSKPSSSELFNHSNLKITKCYLGIKEKEIGDVYLN